MTLRFEELPAPAVTELPSSYVLIAMYAGSSSFPMTTFAVLRVWWEQFAQAPDFQVQAPARPAASFSPDEIEHASSITLRNGNIFA